MRAAYSYHLLSGALRPAEAMHRFPLAWAARRVLHGMVDHEAYVAECEAASVRRMPMRQVQRQCAEGLALDCNPVALLMLSAPGPQAFEARWNGYNRQAAIGVRTFLRPHEVQRSVARGGADTAFRAEAIAVLLELLRSMPRLGAQAEADLPLQALARRLALPAWQVDLLALLQSRVQLPLAEAAGELGVSRRTLQRRLQQHDTSYEVLQAAVRLTAAAHAMVRGGSTLTAVAHESGYSDSAHLARSWRASTGLAPSEFLRLWR